MPKGKYERIYLFLKEKIETGKYPHGELLPSEHTLTAELNCSRNTLRRAIGELVKDGYVQTMQGKGVRNIFEPTRTATFTLGTIETFFESATRNNRKSKSKILHFSEIEADSDLAKKTGFPVGSKLYYIQRLHYLDDKPLILNHNYFLRDIAQNLTEEIALHSIYKYLEEDLHVSIINSKRFVTVEKATETDKKYINLGDYNCMAVVTGKTYNDDGIMFEYSQSRHHPKYFRFQDNALRKQ